MERFLETPIELTHPVIDSAKPERWEAYRLGYPGSINHNGTHFIMHYAATTSDQIDTIVNKVSIAISRDGVKWKRKQLRLVGKKPGWGKGKNLDTCVMLDKY